MSFGRCTISYYMFRIAWFVRTKLIYCICAARSLTRSRTNRLVSIRCHLCHSRSLRMPILESTYAPDDFRYSPTFLLLYSSVSSRIASSPTRSWVSFFFISIIMFLSLPQTFSSSEWLYFRPSVAVFLIVSHSGLVFPYTSKPRRIVLHLCDGPLPMHRTYPAMVRNGVNV